MVPGDREIPAGPGKWGPGRWGRYPSRLLLGPTEALELVRLVRSRAARATAEPADSRAAGTCGLPRPFRVGANLGREPGRASTEAGRGGSAAGPSVSHPGLSVGLASGRKFIDPLAGSGSD